MYCDCLSFGVWGKSAFLRFPSASVRLLHWLWEDPAAGLLLYPETYSCVFSLKENIRARASKGGDGCSCSTHLSSVIPLTTQLWLPTSAASAKGPLQLSFRETDLFSDPVFNYLVVKFIIQVRVYGWYSFLCFMLFIKSSIFSSTCGFVLCLCPLISYMFYYFKVIGDRWKVNAFAHLPFHFHHRVEVFLDFHQTLVFQSPNAYILKCSHHKKGNGNYVRQWRC